MIRDLAAFLALIVFGAFVVLVTPADPHPAQETSVAAR
jgi:hypothetical protein